MAASPSAPIVQGKVAQARSSIHCNFSLRPIHLNLLQVYQTPVELSNLRITSFAENVVRIFVDCLMGPNCNLEMVYA